MSDRETPAPAFSNSVCVITGAGSGIGRALAINLAARGAKLAISDVNPDAITETAQLALSAGSRSGAEVEPYVLDVSDRDAVFAHAEEVKARFGPANLVINNAGVAVGANIVDLAYEDFEWLMNINFWGVVHGSKAFLPQLIGSGDGHLVNVSSIFGIIAVPSQGAYNAAKFAVRGFTEALRQELLIAHAPVTVSCVHPGGVKTNIALMARYTGEQFGTQQQAADAFEKIAKLTPEQAATIILNGVEKGRARILVGNDARIIYAIERLFGSRYQQIVYRFTNLTQKSAKRAAAKRG